MFGYRINLPILFVAFMWWWSETNYFGWNSRPGSVEELFADGLAYALIAMSFAFPRQGRTKVVVNVAREREGNE